MNTEELRKACEMAGMEFDPDWDEFSFDGFEYKDYDPALPAYVASLLLAKVRGSVLDIRDLYVMQFANNSEAIDATDEQRIRAAMAVLEKGE